MKIPEIERRQKLQCDMEEFCSKAASGCLLFMLKNAYKNTMDIITIVQSLQQTST